MLCVFFSQAEDGIRDIGVTSSDVCSSDLCALLAGGGMRTGQVIGATDRIAAEAVARPVTFGELYATLYRNLGIDASRTTMPDLAGRPQYLVEDHAPPVGELA